MAHPPKVTKEVIQKFLEILSDNGGIVTDAADLINLPRKTLYEHREKNPEFKAAWIKAVDDGVDVLEDECRARALVGTEKPVTYQGEITDYYFDKSDYCLGMLLRAHRPKFRTTHTEISGPDGGPIRNVSIKLPAKDPAPDDESGSDD
jgi:hypothetical protein